MLTRRKDTNIIDIICMKRNFMDTNFDSVNNNNNNKRIALFVLKNPFEFGIEFMQFIEFACIMHLRIQVQINGNTNEQIATFRWQIGQANKLQIELYPGKSSNEKGHQ